MKFTILIPTARNDGTPLTAIEQSEIVNQLWQTFGGATIEGIVEGHWIDVADGRHYQDQCLKVTVVCSNDLLADDEKMVIDIGRRLGQKAMYFEVQNYDGVRFLKIDD